MGAGIAHSAYCPVDLGGSMEQGVVHTPEFPGDGEMRVPSGLIPGQPCSEPWLEIDGMFIHSETAETAQAQRKLWGVFSRFCSTIYFQKPFLSSTASGSMWGLQLNCDSLIFLFPSLHKHEGKRLPQKQRVWDSFRLSARGKCPPGKFSDGETLEGERETGEGVRFPLLLVPQFLPSPQLAPPLL